MKASLIKLGLLNTSVTLIVSLFTLSSHAGADGSGGGKPRILNQVSLGMQLNQLANALPASQQVLAKWIKGTVARNEIVGYEGGCQIYEFPTVKANHPQRYWAQRLNEQKILLDPAVFSQSLSTQAKVLSELQTNQLKNTSTASNIQALPKTGKLKSALVELETTLASSVYDKWMKEAYKSEITSSQFFVIPTSCFIVANNQEDDITDSQRVVGVRGFTLARPGANVYFASPVLGYVELDLKHIIVSEVGHHLPIGKEALNESTVNDLATTFVMGSESVESQAIMADLNSRLLVYKILDKAVVAGKIKLPEITKAETEDKTPISGPIPNVMLNLRNFLDSNKIQESSLSIFNGFNELYHNTVLTSLRDCSMSYWNYGAVEYDRSVNGEFKTRKPTELEAIKMQLYRLDANFCEQVNNVFGSSFIEYSGYGTSSLQSAEQNCQQMNAKRKSDLDFAHISKEKQKQLIELDRAISDFNKLLCVGVKKFYSLATPFKGNQNDREMILAVLAGDSQKVEKYLKAGVNPNLQDTRTKFSTDYHREGNFSVYWRQYSENKNLMQIASEQNNSAVIDILSKAGASK